MDAAIHRRKEELVKMEFIYKELNKKIEDLMMKSDEIVIITAFIKKTSIPFFEKIPHKNISIICGIDFFISDPEAILKCDHLFESIKIFHNQKSVFHPKCYYIKSRNEEFLIVGSSNMTLGGFERNYEASLLIKKDYSNENIFKDFQNYYKILQSSSYLFDIDSKLFDEYQAKYSENSPKVDKFNQFINSEIFNDYKPVDSVNDFQLDDWIFHNKLGIGTIIGIEKNIIDVVFLKDKQIKLQWSTNLQKLHNFTNALTKDFFSLEKEKQLLEFYEEFKLTEKNNWLKKRNDFYKKWNPILKRKVTKNEIHNFFEESANLWTLFELKKNWISEKSDDFNRYLSVLNDEKKSIFERYNLVCKKGEEENVFGIGRAITSSILNILYPGKCPVFNNASDKVLEYFGIHENKKHGESPAAKYTRFRLISSVLRDKYKFQDLVEVDCFVGYIKTKYINSENT